MVQESLAFGPWIPIMTHGHCLLLCNQSFSSLTDSCESILKFIILSEIITFFRRFSILVFDLIIDSIIFHNRFLKIEFLLKLTNELVPIFCTEKYLVRHVKNISFTGLFDIVYIFIRPIPWIHGPSAPETHRSELVRDFEICWSRSELAQDFGRFLVQVRGFRIYT